MRGRFRRRASPIADLDVTAFINLMVVLVAFFLSSVTYFKFSSLELNIPPASSGDANSKAPLELEIIIRKDALEVNNRRGGLIRRLPQQDKHYDFKALSTLLKEIKGNFPDKLDATILPESDVPYDTLIKTMDAVRSYGVAAPNGKVTYVELFPELSIGDAPRGQP